MRRCACVTVCLLVAAIGCSKSGSAKTGGAQASAPITEADVKTAMTEYVNRTQGFYPGKAKSVEILSGVLEPSEQFFQKNPNYGRNSVACYVLIQCEPKPGQDKGAKFEHLVVVVRDQGKLNVPIQISGTPPILRETFGDEWVNKHPRPAAPKDP